MSHHLTHTQPYTHSHTHMTVRVVRTQGNVVAECAAVAQQTLARHCLSAAAAFRRNCGTRARDTSDRGAKLIESTLLLRRDLKSVLLREGRLGRLTELSVVECGRLPRRRGDVLSGSDAELDACIGEPLTRRPSEVILALSTARGTGL